MKGKRHADALDCHGYCSRSSGPQRPCLRRTGYTLKVPDGLAFSEFRGYEDWKVIAASHQEKLKLIEVNRRQSHE